ncbi:MAG: hypothetical protein ACTSU5_09305 [Promethearchaeota archaeon]
MTGKRGSTVVLIPVAPNDSMKSRLSGVLDDRERFQLVFSMLYDLLESCLEAKKRTWIDDVVVAHNLKGEDREKDEIWRLVVGMGFHFLEEKDNASFNDTIALMSSFAMEKLGAASSILVFCDLPLVSARNFKEVASIVGEMDLGVLISPSEKDGVSFLCRKPADVIPAMFGNPGDSTSFANHVKYALERGIPVRLYDSFTTHFDVDLPTDLVLVQNYLKILKPASRTLEFLRRKTMDWKVSTGDGSNRELKLLKTPKNKILTGLEND